MKAAAARERAVANIKPAAIKPLSRSRRAHTKGNRSQGNQEKKIFAHN
jgi:hypothetical protein